MGIPNVQRSLRDRSKSRVRNHDEEEVVKKDPLPIPGTTKKAVRLTTRKSILKKQKLSEGQEDYLSKSLCNSCRLYKDFLNVSSYNLFKYIFSFPYSYFLSSCLLNSRVYTPIIVHSHTYAYPYLRLKLKYNLFIRLN